MTWKKATISTFLNERKGRYKPDEAMRMKLKRIDKIDFSNNIHLSETTETKTDMILVKQGDLVISGINAEKGAIAIYRGEEDIMATIHYSSYTYNEKEIDIDYLKWFLKSETFLNTLKEQTKGGIKTELKPNRLLPLEIYLPDKPTQKQILKKLNNIEEEVLELEENIDDTADLIKKLRQSILQDAVKGKLVSQNAKDEPATELLKRIKAEKEKLIKQGKIKKEKTLPPIRAEVIPYDLPKGWAWCRLGEIFNELKYGTSIPCNYRQTSKTKPVLRIPNVSSGIIDGADLKFGELPAKEFSNLSLLNGDVLIIRSNGSRDLVGRPSLVTEDFVGYAYAGYLVRLRFNSENIFSPFIIHILNSRFTRKQIEIPLRTTVGINNVNSTEISNIIIPLPPLAEQNRIVEKVNELMEFCSSLEKEITHSKQEADYLLNAILRETFISKPVKEYPQNEIQVSLAAEE